MIYDFLLDRYGEQGRYVTVSRDYLLDLYDLLHPKGVMKVYVLKGDEGLVSGLVDLYYRGRAYSWVGNPKPAADGVSSDLLQWEAICRAYASGCVSYEEIGADTERLCRYKSKYNPSLGVYFTAKKYNTIMARVSEIGYFNIIRPLLGRINPGRRIKCL